MFSNRFNNTKNDPLLEAVKTAQHDGECRRAAEAIVNEEFGVYSRNAVIREQLAAYDAAVEEAYKCMKEGDVENIMNPNSSWAKKQAADKNNPFNQPTPDPKDVAPNIMIRGNTQGGSSSIMDKAKSLFREGKKLADKDYDKDGKIESPKDEVWGSRFRAAKAAGKMEEEKDIAVWPKTTVQKTEPGVHMSSTRVLPKDRAAYEKDVFSKGAKAAKFLKATSGKMEEEQIDELSQETKKSYVSKRGSQLSSMKYGPDKNYNTLTGRQQKNAVVGIKRAMKEGKWEGSKEDKDEDKKLAKKHGMTMAQWERSAADKKHDAKEKHMKEGAAPSLNKEETDYSAQDRAPVTRTAPKEDPSLPKSYPGAASSAPTASRLSNAKAAVTPIKEDQLDELKQTTIRSYIDKAHARMSAAKTAGFKKDYSEKKGKKAEKARAEFTKRSKGLGLAGKKLDEAKYSAKAARAGEDIGKPGKTFSKIAKKAGEKYGSEERGKKVAGAILAKIRAKHMKEDSSFNAAQETGKSVNEVAMAMPPAITPPSVVGQRMPGIVKRGGTATGKFVSPTRAQASGPSRPASRALTTSSSTNVPATTSAKNVTAASQGASKATSGFSYSRLGDRPMMGGMNPEDRIGGAFKSAASKGAVRSIVTKAAGRAAGIAGLAVPDSTKTEPGNPVFRKTDTGKTQVAGYRSSTTPRAGTTDKNTQTGMVGNMSRRSGMAPSVRNQELPAKIAPVTTKEPGTLSAPVAKPAKAPAAVSAKPEPVKQTFSQAFAAARKEAGGGKGQFEYGGKQYQTNINPAKGTEKYIAPSAQKKTSVSAATATKTTPETSTPAPATQSPGSTTATYKEPATPRRLPDSMGGSEPKTAVPSPTSSPEMKASVATPTSKAEPSYSADSPAGKAWANRGKFGTQQENKMVAESVVSVGNYKYRIV